MLVKDAVKITDSLTGTSKMPGKSYSLPAWECQTGSKLWNNPKSPCFFCYAKKNNYVRYPAIKAAQYRRLDAIKHPLWVDAMVAQIKRMKWFRWHDAGDVQSVEHMNKILEVARQTPDTKHWMPTQERPYLPAPEDVPDNMIIRLSAARIDGSAGNAWSHSSSVVTDGSETCPSGKQGNKCLDCRACWNKDIKTLKILVMVNTRKTSLLKEVISPNQSTDWRGRAPGPGLKDQASSVKLSNQPEQASSDKRQAPGCKLQASSHKRQAP